MLSDALGEVARGLEVIEFACGIPHCSRASTPSRSRPARRLLDPAAARRRRRHHARSTSRRWCPCGCGRPPSPAATAFVLKPSREGPVRIASSSPSCSRRPGCRTASSTSSTATRWPSTRCSSTRTSPPSASSARRRSRSTSTRRARARQARPGARRREEPHGRPARRRPRHGRRRRGQRRLRLGGRALHGDLGRRRASATSPTSSSARSRTRLPKIKVGAGLEPDSEMGPLITREHRDKVASLRRRRARAGRRRSSSTGASGSSTATASSSASRCSTTSRPRWTPTATRSSGRCSRSCASTTYDEAVELVNENPYGNGMAIFTRDGGAARQFQFDVEVGMVGDQRADPGAGRVLLLRRLEELASSATRTSTGPEGIHFYTRGKVVTLALARPGHLEGRPRLPADEMSRCGGAWP